MTDKKDKKEEKKVEEKQLTVEERLKIKMKELKKRDPFIYK